MPKLKNHENKFGEVKVWTTELPFTRAAKLEARLARMVLSLAPSFVELKAGNLGRLNTGGLSSIVDSLDGDRLIRFMLDVFACTSVLVVDDAAPNGERVEIKTESDLDRCFNGYALEAHEALMWVIGINFERFGKGLLDKVVEAVKKAKQDPAST